MAKWANEPAFPGMEYFGASDTVTISKEEYTRLLESDAILRHLQESSVNNSEGTDDVSGEVPT